MVVMAVWLELRLLLRAPLCCAAGGTGCFYDGGDMIVLLCLAVGVM